MTETTNATTNATTTLRVEVEIEGQIDHDLVKVADATGVMSALQDLATSIAADAAVDDPRLLGATVYCRCGGQEASATIE